MLASPGLLITFIVMASTGFGNISIPFLLSSVFAMLVGLLGFRYFTIINLRKFNSSHFKLSNKISGLFTSGDKTIIFHKKTNWECSEFKDIVPFELKGMFFQKAFIEAFVTRALRYRKISNQLPIGNIGNYRIKGIGKKLNVFIEFRTKKRSHRVSIANNGISKPHFLAWFITWVCSPQKKSYRFWKTTEEGNMIVHFDEELFCGLLH